MTEISTLPEGVMLNVYPDSCGGSLKGLIRMLKREEFREVFSCLYILPSLFKSDLDRGFSIISYDLNKELAEPEDLKALEAMNFSLKLDFVLNHLSVQSPQFKDLLEKGDESEYVDSFIDWNKFWQGKGEAGPEGYIIPRDEYLSRLFMRKPELPILKVPFPDGTSRFFWNTFYQKVTRYLPSPEELAGIEGIQTEDVPALYAALKKALKEDSSLDEYDFGINDSCRMSLLSYINRHCTSYLGQMDLNADSEKVWAFFKETLGKLSSYGARIIRLDAFAYLHKKAGMSNFFNEPGTWDVLERIRQMADSYGITLLPEIHSKQEERIHEKVAEKGYPIYDFFFPGLLINAIETAKADKLLSWIREIQKKDFQTVNMLGCHDGIPVLDVKGLLDDSAIEDMISIIKSRGGLVKDLYGADGKKISYYQINATFFSALGENPEKMLLARAIQMFMPGLPEVWYLDLFAGKNDYLAADTLGHKDINRTNLTNRDIDDGLKKPLVREQLELIRFRNTNPAFRQGSRLEVESSGENILILTWKNGEHQACLEADLKTFHYKIKKGIT